MDLAGYARFHAMMEGKRPEDTDAVLASLGETRASLEAAQRAFDKRLQHDTKLRAEMGVRVLLERGRKAKRELPPPAIARVVRSTPCHNCGGFKRTEPRTAYVYCDFCGALFDYDDSRAGQDTGMDDLGTFNLLVDGVRAEIRAAFEAHDDDAYRKAWRWPYEMDMTLFPDGWSPRARDPAYRSAMIDFSVETTVLENRGGTTSKGADGRLRATQSAMRSSPTAEAMTSYVAALRAWLGETASAFERANLFAKHPDKLDANAYVRMNVMLQTLEWRKQLPAESFRQLLTIANVHSALVDVPPVAIHRASCGQCGDKLLVPDGANAIVCEACGHERNPKHGAFACPTCGAHLLLAPGETTSTCAWCASVLAVT